jgi:hypothetical protein
LNVTKRLDMELEDIRTLLQNSSHPVSVFVNAQGEDRRGEDLQALAGELIAAGLTQGSLFEDSQSATGPFLAFSADNRQPRHFYQSLPSGKEWQPFYHLIRTLATGEVVLSPRAIISTRNLNESVTLRILITSTCPFCAQVVTLVNQLAAASPLLKTWIIDAQLFPEWLLKYPVKSVPAIILDEEVVKTGLITDSELAGLLEKRNSREYLAQLYRNDLMEKRLGPALERLTSRLQDIPLIAGLIKAEEFGVKLGAMALMEQLSEKIPQGHALMVDALVPLLQESSEQILGDAAYLIGTLQDPRKISILKRFLNHPNPEISEIAQEGINQGQGQEEGER